jgi:hypothetical protein
MAPQIRLRAVRLAVVVPREVFSGDVPVRWMRERSLLIWGNAGGGVLASRRAICQVRSRTAHFVFAVFGANMCLSPFRDAGVSREALAERSAVASRLTFLAFKTRNSTDLPNPRAGEA